MSWTNDPSMHYSLLLHYPSIPLLPPKHLVVYYPWVIYELRLEALNNSMSLPLYFELAANIPFLKLVSEHYQYIGLYWTQCLHLSKPFVPLDEWHYRFLDTANSLQYDPIKKYSFIHIDYL